MKIDIDMFLLRTEGRMEIKVNKEIMDYHESLLLGLNMREILSIVVSAACAGAAYFLLKGLVGTSITGWICLAVAAPGIIFGFIKVNGVTFEKFIVSYIRFWTTPRTRIFISENFYEEEDKVRERKTKR